MSTPSDASISGMGSKERSFLSSERVTSALTGEPIPEIDCPETPLQLLAGDVIVVASDGLQYLSEPAIKRVLTDNLHMTSHDIGKALLDAVTELNDPEQDNLSCSIMKVTPPQITERHADRFAVHQQADTIASVAARAVVHTPKPEPADATPIFHRLRRITGNLF